MRVRVASLLHVIVIRMISSSFIISEDCKMVLLLPDLPYRVVYNDLSQLIDDSHFNQYQLSIKLESEACMREL